MLLMFVVAIFTSISRVNGLKRESVVFLSPRAFTTKERGVKEPSGDVQSRFGHDPE